MRRGLVLAVAAGALLSAACNDGHTPALTNLKYNGAAPDSPLVLLLSLDFEDGDGDLASCTAIEAREGDRCVLDTFINDRPTSAGPLPLLPIFVKSGVTSSATSGTLNFVLELSFNGDAPPQDGSTFSLGARASDESQNTSTTQEIKLRLENG
jgi:hypothetical protein